MWSSKQITDGNTSFFPICYSSVIGTEATFGCGHTKKFPQGKMDFEVEDYILCPITEPV